jgi:uncharacterized protein YbjT (DUF2867 family)
MRRILVTGSTGTLGRPVVQALRERGHDVRGLSRRPGQDFQADLTTGTGLDVALTGTDTVVHCASNTRRLGRGDVEGTRNLLAAATRTGKPHLIFVSIVGVDRIPYPYYQQKVVAERLVEAYGGTIQRATQFHEFLLGGARLLTRPPIALVPDVPVQPVSTRDVALRLADLADDPAPPGRAPDLGGPEIFEARDLFGAYLRAAGRSRRLVPFRLPGRVFRAFRAGAHLTPENRSAGEHWSDFLARSR